MSETAGFDVRDRERFVFYETSLRRGTLALARIVFKALMQLDVEGLQNVPAAGGFVLASNHVTNWDVFPMQLALPRTIFFMGKAELFRFRPLGALFRDFGAFPVYRGEKDEWAFRHAVKVLQAGQVLGMFPEGHRSRGGGLRAAKTGTARLAMEAGCPILPMALTGTDHFLSALPHRRQVRVSFLPFIHAQPGDTAEGLTDRLMYALAAALPEKMRGVYAVERAPEPGG
jgi:1-acyl-sn-glycerol-3-phosphate acyltransferase